MTFENLKRIIEDSISEFQEKDQYLLTHDVHEQAISHKLACYIGNRIEHWNVDAEYNRNIDEPKSLTMGNVRPDIIIHRRGLNNDGDCKDNNLIIIEIKKKSNQQKKIQEDIAVIKAFINDTPYFYKYGAFISFDGSPIQWFCRDENC